MILPHYFVETQAEKECHSLVRYSTSDGAATLLECHEYDAQTIAALLNVADPEGEEFLRSGIDRVVDNDHLYITPRGNK